MPNPPLFLLVDLTNIAARCAFAGPALRPPAQAAATAVGMIARVAAEMGATHLACCADAPGPTWRHTEADDYKAGRSFDTTPYLDAALRAADARGWVCVEAEGFEADDVIAAAVARLGEAFDLVIYSGDGDAHALVRPACDLVGSVRVCWPVTGGSYQVHTPPDVVARYGVSPAQLADYKAVAGEPGDNVPGLGGRTPSGAVAERKAIARKLLTTYGTLDRALDVAERLATGYGTGSSVGAPPLMVELYEARDRVRRARRLLTLSADAPLPDDLADVAALPQLAAVAP